MMLPRLSRTTTLVLLAAAACLQQARYLGRAVLPAADVVDTVAVAQRIERDGLAATIRSEPVPPLFPALVAATHAGASRLGIIEPRDWASPPQWVAAAALIAALLPIFLLTERLAGQTAATLATALFIALPVTSRLGADGLGDALYLCLTCWGVWLFIAARSFGAGLCIAAALLVRIESAVVPLVVSAWSAGRAAFRVPRFFVAVALCIVPYIAVGVIDPTAIAQRIRGGAAPTDDFPLNDSQRSTHHGRDWTNAVAGTSLTFGRKDHARSTRFHGAAATLHEYGTELLQAFGFALLPLAAAGIVVRRRDGRWSDADRLLTTAAALHLMVVFGLAWRGGYLSTRHFALPVVLSLPYAAVGLIALGEQLADAIRSRLPTTNLRLEPLAALGFVIASLVVTARPLHESQRPHRDAADWLATHDAPGVVLDQQGYSALYTGRTTYRFDAAESAFADAGLQYVVVERADLEADTPRGASLRHVLGGADQAAVVFPADRDRRHHDVLIFTQPHRQLASAGDRHAR